MSIWPSGSMYRSERTFLTRDCRRIAAKMHPVLVKTTPTRRDDSHHNDKSDNCGYGSGDRRRPFTADQCPLHLCCFPSLLATSVGVCEQSNLSAIPGLAKSSCCGERNYGSQARSMTIRFYFKVAVQFVQSLAHSSQ